MRRAAIGCLTLLVLATARPHLVAATEGPSEETCRTAYEQGQRHNKKHALLAARVDFKLCAHDPCPKAFQPECIDWLAQVEKNVPSIVPIVATSSGQTLSDVRVLVDGVVVSERISETPIELDPGEHRVRFELEDLPPIERTLVVVEGEKSKIVRVELPPPRPVETKVSPEPPSAHAVADKDLRPKAPTAAYVLGAVGVVGLASFGYFGITGLSQRGALDKCNPHCSSADIDSTRRRFLIADVSLGVSVVSLGVATYLFLGRGDRAAEVARLPSIGVTSSAGGALLVFDGAF